jgi:hypothetical protein
MSGLTPRDLRAFAADAGAFAVSRVMKENADSLEDEDPCAEEQEDEESLLYSADVVLKEDIKHLPVVVQHDDGDKVCKEAGNEMSVIEPGKQRSSMQRSQRQFQVRVEDLEKALECMKVRTASAIGTPKVLYLSLHLRTCIELATDELFSQWFWPLQRCEIMRSEVPGLGHVS